VVGSPGLGRRRGLEGTSRVSTLCPVHGIKLRIHPSLLQKFAHDIRITLSPSYEGIISRLVEFLPRRISAEALTALLAAFSALFKHVLIPGGDDQLVETTWNLFKEVLPMCNAEIQRATAEVWGATLRRFKLPTRSILVQLLAVTAVENQDACAWIFVIACKVVQVSLF
jgi:U3 small nucleolar RNA-associated protein 20